MGDFKKLTCRKQWAVIQDLEMDDVFAGESYEAGMDASEAFVQQLTTQVNRKDIRAMVADQVHM